MIGWHELDLPIGTKFVRLFDEGGIIYNQPALIIRKATKEEFIEDYILRHGKIKNNLLPNNIFFYEIITD